MSIFYHSDDEIVQFKDFQMMKTKPDTQQVKRMKPSASGSHNKREREPQQIDVEEVKCDLKFLKASYLDLMDKTECFESETKSQFKLLKDQLAMKDTEIQKLNSNVHDLKVENEDLKEYLSYLGGKMRNDKLKKKMVLSGHKGNSEDDDQEKGKDDEGTHSYSD